tara:strand:- start:8134 stop:8634 length:501 start_codon:yes stop_codon:yes gene_type:complete
MAPRRVNIEDARKRQENALFLRQQLAEKLCPFFTQWRMRRRMRIMEKSSCLIQAKVRGMQTRSSGNLQWRRLLHVTAKDLAELSALVAITPVKSLITGWRFNGTPDYFNIYGYIVEQRSIMFTSRVIRMYGTSFVQTLNSLYMLGEPYYPNETQASGVSCSEVLIN